MTSQLKMTEIQPTNVLLPAHRRGTLLELPKAASKIHRPAEKLPAADAVSDVSKVMRNQEFLLIPVPFFAGILLINCQTDQTVNDMFEMLVSGVATKIREYEMLCGELPREEYGLQALVTRPESLAEDVRWVQLYDEVPSDPWGGPIYYFIDKELPHGFGVYICGPDGISKSRGNDSDDINNWDSASL
jgi:hypothetical protein